MSAELSISFDSVHHRIGMCKNSSIVKFNDRQPCVRSSLVAPFESIIITRTTRNSKNIYLIPHTIGDTFGTNVDVCC